MYLYALLPNVNEKFQILFLADGSINSWLINFLFQYRQYKAKFVSVTMQNFQDLNLISNNVSYTDTMVHSHVNISLPQPIISTTISYYSYPNTQTREIHAQYSVDYANASVELHKELKGGQLQLFGVKVNVSKVHAVPSQGPYEGDVAGLIDFLGSKLQHSIARSLESFLNSQVSSVLTKGKLIL